MTLTTLQLSKPFGRVAYQEAGRGAPLVLIHGVGMQSAAWAPQIDALSADYRVIALDMPGHGDSDPLPGNPELSDYVAWLDEIVKALDLGAVYLAGHSMGALISGGYAVSYPEKVARVALLNGVFRRTAEARAAVQVRAEEIRSGSFDLETPLKRWFGDSPAERSACEQVAEWLSAVNHKGYADAYSAFAGGDEEYADGFADIRCPLLALTGADDPNSTPAMANSMAEAAPQGRAVVIDGQRHMVNLTAPEQVNAILLDWLQTPWEERETA
ncbi:alpha/beta fold hydrolase [Ruegeria lacuscaerulensis]|uniref:alpha/beta fold hydrolase n=1 Tax=Ruegeria lacuscaerulensis TaxID=55218 RepID=UPI00147B9F49|nr:alpha/beta hydrolase [Ruegeria lacuscaerulensis]